MNFISDLADIIKQQFEKAGISYDNRLDVRDLTAHYLEMLNRRVVPTPRRVHLSDEIHDSLGKLAHESNKEQKEKALEAWRTVFDIRHLLAKGENVTRFLSKSVNDFTSQDKMLWDFGMHHFHLNRTLEPSGDFVERSDYLLFAIIADADAYFVDVRPHRDPQRLEWVRQDLLAIVHSNWPKLIEANILRGILGGGSGRTDEEIKELRRKSINHTPQFGKDVIFSLGGGMMTDGSSTLCRIWTSKLLHEVEQHQSYFDDQPAELRSGLESNGIEIAGKMEFELVLLESLNPPAEIVARLTADQCLSKGLCRMGFVIVEKTTRVPIVVSLKEEL